MFARPMASVTGNPVKISRLFWDLFEPKWLNLLVYSPVGQKLPAMVMQRERK
jgi:hypothetical protein